MVDSTARARLGLPTAAAVRAEWHLGRLVKWLVHIDCARRIAADRPTFVVHGKYACVGIEHDEPRVMGVNSLCSWRIDRIGQRLRSTLLAYVSDTHFSNRAININRLNMYNTQTRHINKLKYNNKMHFIPFLFVRIERIQHSCGVSHLPSSTHSPRRSYKSAAQYIAKIEKKTRGF